jgi:hypothetical protein
MGISVEKIRLSAEGAPSVEPTGAPPWFFAGL